MKPKVKTPAKLPKPTEHGEVQTSTNLLNYYNSHTYLWHHASKPGNRKKNHQLPLTYSHLEHYKDRDKTQDP